MTIAVAHKRDLRRGKGEGMVEGLVVIVGLFVAFLLFHRAAVL
jgi:hypothetical protein